MKKQEKHGESYSVEYTTWLSLKSRCLNPKNGKFKSHGGRGIKVCDQGQHSFSNFLSDMGRRPSNTHSLDRINNNGNYEPEYYKHKWPLC